MLTDRRIVATILLIATLLVGCGATPDPTPIPLPSPQREARTVPQPNGAVRIEAVSAGVVPNQPYVFPVFTHCGFTATSFDFDGSFWAILDFPAGMAGRNGNPPDGIDNPTDIGVIVLLGADRAAWQSRIGAVFRLGRGPSETQAFGCD